MSERKPAGVSRESWVERQIRAAMERGERIVREWRSRRR